MTDDNTEGRKEGIDAGERLGESPILDGRAAAGRTEDDMEERSGRSQPLQLMLLDHEFNPQQQREEAASQDEGQEPWLTEAGQAP
jgi:hypothetical protein